MPEPIDQMQQGLSCFGDLKVAITRVSQYEIASIASSSLFKFLWSNQSVCLYT